MHRPVCLSRVGIASGFILVKKKISKFLLFRFRFHFNDGGGSGVCSVCGGVVAVTASTRDFEKERFCLGEVKGGGWVGGGSVGTFKFSPGCQYGCLPYTEQPPELVVTL